MYRIPTFALFALLITTANSQVEDAEQPDIHQRPVTNDAYQGGWLAAPMQKNAEVWRRIVADEPGNAMNQLNNFRSIRNAALVRNQGSLSSKDEQELEALAAGMDRSAPNTFETHMAKHYLLFPEAAAFEHLDKASTLGADRVELIGPQLVNSMRTGSEVDTRKWALALKQRGEVAPGLWLLADDILRSVDKNGLLVTAGEMDAYPVWARQFADGLRRDVLVIDVRLLDDGDYRQRCWRSANARGTVPGDADRFIAQLATASDRPVFLSMALGPDRVRNLGDRLQVSGLALRLGAPYADQFQVLEQRWKAMNKAVNAGPLSRNYLVPGAVLLKYYRAVGDEERSASLEHELRTMANAMGETDRLYRIGLLEH